MPTFKQLIKNNQRPSRKYKTRVKDLRQCPQKKGICFKLFIMTPKKPNSAKRKVAKIKLSTKKFVFGYIPGEGNNLQRFSQVLIRGGLIRDLPGVHYTIIRGKLDLHSVFYRRQGRSKYGTKIWWKPKKKDRASAKILLKKQSSDFVKKKVYNLKYRYYKKHFLNWIVYKMYIVRNKKTKKVLLLPQKLFLTPSFAHIKDKQQKRELITKFVIKRENSIKKFLIKARKDLLATDFLINLKLGRAGNNATVSSASTNIRSEPTKTDLDAIKFNFPVNPLTYRRKAPLLKSGVQGFQLDKRFFTLFNNNMTKSRSLDTQLFTLVLLKGKLFCFRKKLFLHIFPKVFIIQFQQKNIYKLFLQQVIALKLTKLQIVKRNLFLNKKINFFEGIQSLKKSSVKFALTDSFVLDKVLRVFLSKGEKTKMTVIFCKFIKLIKQQFNISFFFLIILLLQQLTISFELLPLKKAGRILYIPVFLPLVRQITFAFKTFKKHSIRRTEQSFLLRIMSEFFDIILYKKGLSLQKLVKINEVAYNSQPNLHYRWKKSP